ncbi:hypothetical protein [Sporosarcina sp. USHLN248]|uniref:hypothetical protein n=1 Tax=Sporosarcina sp. USHLN248 TaxID=3081300 RepID=UPI00301AA708
MGVKWAWGGEFYAFSGGVMRVGMELCVLDYGFARGEMALCVLGEVYAMMNRIMRF